MNIRRATSADGSLLSFLTVDVQRLHAERHPDIFKMPSDDEFALTFFDEQPADQKVSIFIAEAKDQALGCVVCKLMERDQTLFTFELRYLLIDQISVRPEAQGKGVGAALIKQAELLARELNVKEIRLDSWDFNIKAHAFFENQGFEKFNHRFLKKI